MRSLKSFLLAAALAVGVSGGAWANEGVHIPAQSWPHGNPFGSIDKAAAKRGFQIYKEICASCHGLSLLSYRNLAGIGFSADEIKAIAAEYEVTDGPNDNGDMYKRPALPSDRFNAPFANEKAARAANNGAYPPDLSLIAKARKGGEDYLVALLTGYDDPPADIKLADGMSYNKYFAGHQIAMPKMLNDDSVTYADGTKATAQQEARDVATFLVFAAEPSLDARQHLGLKVLLFLLVFSGMMYACKRHMWRNVHH
jgi:ubiquinol-cytochrome c reductase cytochrome c1 subunit